MKPCILVVDDDNEIRESLARLLDGEGFDCAVAADGKEMFEQLLKKMADIILLDVMLPGEDGFELCRELRGNSAMPPVIMLTAKDQEIDRVVGLEIGADDYIIKPFSTRELIARIKVVLRRGRQSGRQKSRGIYRFEHWGFDPARMELVDEEGLVVPLSSSENNLLLAFVQNTKKPLSRDQLLDLTKGKNSSLIDRSIDSHISRLRKKIGDDPRSPEIIKTAWGKGYIFTPEVTIS